MNTFESVLMRWLNLEPTMQNEVSQKRKANIIYSSIYMESRKMVLMNLFSRQQIWRTDLQTRVRGRKEKVGQKEKGHGNIYTAMRKTDSQ